MVLEEAVELEDMKTAVQHSIVVDESAKFMWQRWEKWGKKLKIRIWKGSPSNGIARVGNSCVYLTFLAPQSQESFADTTKTRKTTPSGHSCSWERTLVS